MSGEESFWSPSGAQALSAIVALVISVAVGVVAACQWRTQKRQHRLGLFKERIKIYNAIREFLAHAAHEHPLEPSKIVAFGYWGPQARFITGPKIEVWISDIQDRAKKLSMMESDRAASLYGGAGYSADEFVRETHRLRQSFSDDLGFLPGKFEEYLAVAD